MGPKNLWIDAHTHLEMLEESPEENLLEAQKAGVEAMITIGCHPQDFDKVCTIAQKHYPVIAATLGVHPHEAKHYDQNVENKIREKASEKFIVGIGEIGLDYYYNHSDPEVQRDVFRKQMKLAASVGLPVEIHSRDAEEDTILELYRWKGQVKGMMHCFSGSQRLADEALSLGYYISISGVVTFKNADELRAVVKSIPLDRLLTETDAPFLSPVPLRGKKNKPAFVEHTAKKVAEIKNVSEDELSQQVKKNIKTLFPKWNI